MLVLRIVMGRGFTVSSPSQELPTIHIASSLGDKQEYAASFVSEPSMGEETYSLPSIDIGPDIAEIV